MGALCTCIATGPGISRDWQLDASPGDRYAVTATRSEAVDPSMSRPLFADRTSASGPGNPLSAIPLRSLRTTRERPLFSASRRPQPASSIGTAPVVAATARAAVAPHPETPQVRLVGVIKGPDLQMGIFVDNHTRLTIRAHIGESVRGWIVSGIDRRAATIEKAGQQVKLELQAVTSATTTTPPDPSAPLQGMPVGPIRPVEMARGEQ